MRFISLALLLFAISDTAAAQLAPQRTGRSSRKRFRSAPIATPIR